MRYICYGAFSTAASIVGVIVLFTGGPAIAFEKVRAEVKKVDAVTYVDTQVDPQGYISEMKYFNRGRQARLEFVPSGQARIDMAGSGWAGNFYVFDYKKRKALSVAPSLRAYELYDIPEDDVDAQSLQFVKEVKRLLEGTAIEDGTETIGGVKATAFKIDGGVMYNIKANYKVFVDPKTALPVRISYERKPTSPTDALPIKRTFDRFDWKPVLTDDQFSLDPPKGFTEGIFGFVKPVVPAKK